MRLGDPATAVRQLHFEGFDTAGDGREFGAICRHSLGELTAQAAIHKLADDFDTPGRRKFFNGVTLCLDRLRVAIFLVDRQPEVDEGFARALALDLRFQAYASTSSKIAISAAARAVEIWKLRQRGVG